MYTNLRAIFLQNLHHDEKLGLSHEDFILFYVLTTIHPDLPVLIRDKYSHQLEDKRILDFKSEIFIDAERFIAEFQSKCQDEMMQVLSNGETFYLSVQGSYSSDFTIIISNLRQTAPFFFFYQLCCISSKSKQNRLNYLYIFNNSQ